MTIKEMQERKQELGYSNQYLSRMSGVPEPTIQKIFSGHTKSPRQATIRQLEKVLQPHRDAEKTPGSGYRYSDAARTEPLVVSDAQAAYVVQKKVHTIDEIYALPEGIHAELIDGQIYYMASPTRMHQEITGEMYLAVANHIKASGGSCKVYIPPFAVFLFGDDSTYLEPDLTVVCNPDKLNDKGCVGAPDWIVEVLSPSSRRMDRILKMLKYRMAGVREYWIIDPDTRTVNVFLFNTDNEAEEQAQLYSFEDDISSFTFPDLKIRLSDVV